MGALLSVSEEKLSAIMSLVVAIVILSASFFQWFHVTYNGTKTKAWVKWLLSICVALLLCALFLTLKQ